jgi:hypothetical protein
LSNFIFVVVEEFKARFRKPLSRDEKSLEVTDMTSNLCYSKNDVICLNFVRDHIRAIERIIKGTQEEYRSFDVFKSMNYIAFLVIFFETPKTSSFANNFTKIN